MRKPRMPKLIFPALLLASATASGAEISTREIEPNRFEFVLTNSTALGEREAQALIAREAVAICGRFTPRLGKYRFEAREAVGGETRSGKPDTFQFTQEVTCVAGAVGVRDERYPTLESLDESGRLQEEIRRRSEEYFRLISEGRIEDAFARVSAGVMGVQESTWKDEKRAFQSMAGKPQRIEVVKITVYDNPAEAPEPGLYVAADFSNSYENLPINCGYLMWFRPIGGSGFLISREENGLVTAEQLKLIPSSQLPEIKRKLRCVDP